jgi:hypothetical protein
VLGGGELRDAEADPGNADAASLDDANEQVDAGGAIRIPCSRCAHTQSFILVPGSGVWHHRYPARPAGPRTRLLAELFGDLPMSVQRYIETLTLSSANVPLAVRRRPVRELGGARGGTASAQPSTGEAIPADLKAAVDVGSLMSFVEGVGPTEKEDVLLSIQLAQRGASGKYDRFSQTESWYQKYVEVLEQLGWVGEQFAFAKYDQQQGELRMDQAALAIITAIATQNQLAVLKESVDALAKLTEDDGTIRLFDFHSSTQASGNFQIGAVQKADNGALSLALGAFYFRSSDARRRFLFFSWGAQQVAFWTGAQKLTLNQEFYAERREAVRRKLGTTADEYIAGLELG